MPKPTKRARSAATNTEKELPAAKKPKKMQKKRIDYATDVDTDFDSSYSCSSLDSEFIIDEQPKKTKPSRKTATKTYADKKNDKSASAVKTSASPRKSAKKSTANSVNKTSQTKTTKSSSRVDIVRSDETPPPNEQEHAQKPEQKQIENENKNENKNDNDNENQVDGNVDQNALAASASPQTQSLNRNVHVNQNGTGTSLLVIHDEQQPQSSVQIGKVVKMCLKMAEALETSNPAAIIVNFNFENCTFS